MVCFSLLYALFFENKLIIGFLYFCVFLHISDAVCIIQKQGDANKRILSGSDFLDDEIPWALLVRGFTAFCEGVIFRRFEKNAVLSKCLIFFIQEKSIYEYCT